jgi:hypothetical protein
LGAPQPLAFGSIDLGRDATLQHPRKGGVAVDLERAKQFSDRNNQARDVAYWHFSDMPARPPDICFEG